jgi:hypothetical protein
MLTAHTITIPTHREHTSCHYKDVQRNSVCREKHTDTLIILICGKIEFRNVTVMGTYRVIQGRTNFPKI